MALNKWVTPVTPAANPRRRFGIGRVAVTEADEHVGACQRRDTVGGHQFGRDRDHNATATWPHQQRHQRIVERYEARGIVNPFARDVDHRAFDMNADDTRYARRDRGVGRFQRLADDQCRIADQRRQEGGGAIGTMRRRPIAAIPSTVGSSLNNTPPPPLTWVSMKPGITQPPVKIDRAGGGPVHDRDDDTSLDVDRCGGQDSARA